MLAEAGGDRRKVKQAKEISVQFKKNLLGPDAYISSLSELFGDDSVGASSMRFSLQQLALSAGVGSLALYDSDVLMLCRTVCRRTRGATQERSKARDTQKGNCRVQESTTTRQRNRDGCCTCKQLVLQSVHLRERIG